MIDHRTVTPEVAGSSPVAPVSRSSDDRNGLGSGLYAHPGG
jgi:hypothetical protein